MKELENVKLNHLKRRDVCYPRVPVKNLFIERKKSKQKFNEFNFVDTSLSLIIVTIFIKIRSRVSLL